MLSPSLSLSWYTLLSLFFFFNLHGFLLHSYPYLFSVQTFFFFSKGFGVEMMGNMEHAPPLTPQKEMSARKWRKMMVQLEDDYHDPGPNKPKIMTTYNMAPSPATP
ncbi:unnamed protein product [Citrullus colocynthis]|uniref:Uncharacterized protein n=1 Tax=Citrullus colocynthis TaxID=252529 RepID=A0ABP0XR02_9ROSI